MSVLHFVPPVEILDRDVDELLESSQEPLVATAARQRAPVMAIVGALQSELGIRADRRLEDYGPATSFSEDFLLRAYGVRAQRIEAG
jgi:hypothetical protein